MTGSCLTMHGRQEIFELNLPDKPTCEHTDKEQGHELCQANCNTCGSTCNWFSEQNGIISGGNKQHPN